MWRYNIIQVMLLRGNGFSSKVAQVFEARFLLRAVSIAKNWEIFAVFQAASLSKVEVKPLLRKFLTALVIWS